MVKRSILEIYFDVLEVIQSGTDKPTLIMYETNISWVTLRNVFDVLSESAFITVRKKGKSKRYHITEKGEKALSFHKKSLQEFGITPLMI